jgi:hypothetical protein
MIKTLSIGLMLASAALTTSPALAADATAAARALLSGRAAPPSVATNAAAADARSATEQAQAILSGRQYAPSSSALGVDTAAATLSADERARALLSGTTPAVHERAAPLARADVRAATEHAIRDGSWRCLTNNRGWCGVVGL